MIKYILLTVVAVFVAVSTQAQVKIDRIIIHAGLHMGGCFASIYPTRDPICRELSTFNTDCSRGRASFLSD